jgi:hypothetical protein
MIIAFVGTLDEDESALPITGNGKTVSMTGYGLIDYKKGREVWSNYKTDFSSEIIGFQEMITRINYAVENNQTNSKLVLLVTEMRKILDAIGSTTEQIIYVDNFAEQIRKLGCTLYYDTQRFYSIQKRLRIHTNVILIPHKTHLNDRACYLPSCMKPHKIYVYSYKPEKQKPVKCFNASVIGKHFDTLEFCNDSLNLPSKLKRTKNEA